MIAQFATNARRSRSRVSRQWVVDQIVGVRRNGPSGRPLRPARSAAPTGVPNTNAGASGKFLFYRDKLRHIWTPPRERGWRGTQVPMEYSIQMDIKQIRSGAGGGSV